MLQNPGKALRKLLQGPDIIMAPGIYDCISARVAEQAGFPMGYLSGAGVATGYLGEPDIGLTNGSDVADVARRLRREEINAASPLGLCQFSSFEVERYGTNVEPELGISPREYMGKLLNYCKNYAARFSANSPNLLFMGHSGLGKTHLALAIADAVLEGGHDVLYTSAAALAAQLGKEHFDYTNNEEWLAACQEADLLILDDLGTEYITPLTISVLYELINTRMLTHRPTIYTTNIIDQNIFVARYTEKVASRMLGGCKMFKFFGEDQRLK